MTTAGSGCGKHGRPGKTMRLNQAEWEAELLAAGTDLSIHVDLTRGDREKLSEAARAILVERVRLLAERREADYRRRLAGPGL